MKKIFTLVAMAFVAISMNAQEAGIYPVKSITWKAITWKNGNNKKDKDNKDMLFLMGTGNGYASLLADYYYSEDKGDYFTRASYTYINYEEGETGVPAYGLYYAFTPKTSGSLKVCLWINKGNRKTFVIKASDGKPLTPYVDYSFDGYVNGQNTNTDQPKIDEATGEQAKDNEGNPVWIQAPTYFTASEIQARHDAAGSNLYVLDAGNQAVWGWITFNVAAGETYVVYQQSSQLGFGGYEFTPDGGSTESYISCLDMGGSIVLSSEFSSVVDGSGNATNVTNEGSVVNFGTTNMTVKAVGGAEPESVEADFSGSGINSIQTLSSSSAPLYNLAGQRVNESYKGVVLQNGKKSLKK